MRFAWAFRILGTGEPITTGGSVDAQITSRLRFLIGLRIRADAHRCSPVRLFPCDPLASIEGRASSPTTKTLRPRDSLERGQTSPRPVWKGGAAMITRDLPAYLSAAGHSCFFCGEPVENPSVLWHGGDDQNTNIYFHGECVIRWMPGLWRDALALRYPTYRPAALPESEARHA